MPRVSGYLLYRTPAVAERDSAEFEDWPLHDAVLGPLTLDWWTRTCRLELAVFFRHGEDAEPAVIEWEGVGSVTVSRDEPWGPSDYVNSQRREGERSFVIEIQSGDEIRVVADSVSLHERRAV